MNGNRGVRRRWWVWVRGSARAPQRKTQWVLGALEKKGTWQKSTHLSLEIPRILRVTDWVGQPVNIQQDEKKFPQLFSGPLPDRLADFHQFEPC